VRADVARALFGVNGTGIRVGVISDGIAIVTLAASSGNLPPTQLIRDETGLPIASEGGVTGKSFRADNALQGPLGSPLAEGTALLEIVHDLAPGAQLFFAAISTDVEFASAVEWLAEEAGGPNARRGTVGGVDVIINDFSFLDLGPVDGSNPAAQVAANAVNQGVVFVTAVGNFADRHHRAMFSDPDGNRFHNFAGTDESIRVSVPGRASLVAVLRWDDPWDASTNDYDLRLFDTDGNPVPIGGGSARQIGTGPPFELVSYFNGSTSARSLDIRIENFEGRAAPRLLSLFVLGTGAPIDHNVPLGSVAPPADAHGVISVGAVRSDSPGTIEAFSGQGPTLDGRLKPELVAPDRVSTSVFGGGSFVGTSAAAPHVGAVAALLLSLDPTLTPEKVQRALEVSSTDVGAAGPDPASGFGLVNALAALGLPRADIGLNQSSYSIGDTLILDLLARSGSTLNRGDAYLVALTPTGQLVSLVLEGDGHLHLTEGLVPMQRGFSVLDIEGAIYARRFVASDPRGTYVVFAVLVREGRDPLDHSNWIVFDIEEYALGGVALPQRAGADPPR
jgi:subtilisin family serine protease